MALINLRNAMMSGKRLPYDAEVEYLESDGNQFIKVPGKISSTSRITVTFKYTGAAFSQFAPFGGGDGNMLREASLISSSSPTGNWIYRCNGNQNLNVVNLANSQVHTVTWYKDGSILDGVDYPSLTTTSDFTPTRDYFGLFANLRNGDNSPAYRMCGYIMSAQVYDNGVLVRDFIPVRKGTVGYLYDRVSGRLFGNAGTGDFVLGPDVVPVEYLQSSGTQYINTGIRVDDTYGFNISFMGLNGNDRIIIGVKGAGDSRWALSGTLNPNTNLSWNTSGQYSGQGLLKIQEARVNYLNDRKRVLNGADVGNITSPLNASANSYDVCMFAGHWGAATVSLYSTARIYSTQISKGQEIVRSFRPIRVGTGVTLWEGATMDVLTRRIYRNAGTGAFTYGDDLKYPIPAE